MNQTKNNRSIFGRFAYGAALLLVPTLAVVFLSSGSLPFAAAGFSSQAFAPLSNSKKAPTAAQVTAEADRVPEVKLDQWEYTGLAISNPR